VGGPVAGLVLEAIGLVGAHSTAISAGTSVLRLVKLIEVVRPKLSPEQQTEADAAVREARTYCD
jgi:hypothetical protein